MIALDLSLENLYRQYHHCRRNKRNTLNALRFEADQEKNLIALREILAADFRDRVVHHLPVDHDVTENCRFRGRRELLEIIPPHKTRSAPAQTRACRSATSTASFSPMCI
jgi:hypothetical protein